MEVVCGHDEGLFDPEVVEPGGDRGSQKVGEDESGASEAGVDASAELRARLDRHGVGVSPRQLQNGEVAPALNPEAGAEVLPTSVAVGGGGPCERHAALQARRQSPRESTEGFHNKNPFTHAFFPTLYLPNYISYISLYYLLDPLLFHRRSLTDQLLAIQLRILFNSGTCKVSSPHLVSSD